MIIKKFSKQTATLSRIIMSILILIIVVHIAQGIIIATSEVFRHRKPGVAKPAKPKYDEQTQKLWDIHKANKRFLPDGTIHLVRTIKSYRNKDAEKTIKIYDANNNLLWEGINKDKPYKYLSWASRPRDRFDERRMKALQVINPTFSRSLTVPVRSDKETYENWRYITLGEYFVGYDPNGQIIGYADADGFTDKKAQVKSFGQFKQSTAWCPRDSYSPTLLWQTKHAIYQINFEKQQVETVFVYPDAEIVEININHWRFSSPVTKDNSQTNNRPVLYCKTDDGKNHLIMRHPEQQVTISTPEEWKKWFGNPCRFAAKKQTIYMYRRWIESPPAPSNVDSKVWGKWWQDFRSKPQQNWAELYTIDNAGNLSMVNRFGWIMPARPTTQTMLLRPKLKAQQFVRVLSSPLYDLIWNSFGADFWKRAGRSPGVMDVVQGILRELRPQETVLNWLLCFVMAGAAFVHAWPRRTTWPKFIFWLVIAGAFNLAGLLAYLVMNHTPIIKCSACGKYRGLEENQCIRCGSALPVPQRKNTEIIVDAYCA